MIRGIENNAISSINIEYFLRKPSKHCMKAPPVSRIGWNDEKIMRTRDELKTVKSIMKDNVKKMMERQGRLDELVERAQKLEEASDVYIKSAVKIHREYSWKRNIVRYGLIAVTSMSAVAGIAYSFF